MTTIKELNKFFTDKLQPTRFRHVINAHYQWNEWQYGIHGAPESFDSYEIAIADNDFGDPAVEYPSYYKRNYSSEWINDHTNEEIYDKFIAMVDKEMKQRIKSYYTLVDNEMENELNCYKANREEMHEIAGEEIPSPASASVDNPLRRIAEDLSHRYHTGTFTADFKDHLAEMIESALRGVVEECAGIAKRSRGSKNGYRDIRSHFHITPPPDGGEEKKLGVLEIE